MARAGRSLEEGRVHHIYNRLAGGMMVFSNETLAGMFVSLLREVTKRDGVLTFAWCLLGNHFRISSSYYSLSS